MKIKTLKIYMSLAFLLLIILLSFFNLRAISFTNKAKESCTIDYSSYLKENSCPCISPIKSNFSINSSTFHYIDMGINQISNINKSINPSPSQKS